MCTPLFDSNYRLIKTSTLSQAGPFRAEGAVAIIAALSLVVRPRRDTAAIALVAGSALLVYRYHDIGKLGPSRRCMSPSGIPRKPSRHSTKAQRCLPPSCFSLSYGGGQRRP